MIIVTDLEPEGFFRRGDLVTRLGGCSRNDGKRKRDGDAGGQSDAWVPGAKPAME